MKKTKLFMIFAFMVAFGLTVGPALAADKANILVIQGADIGYWNVSAIITAETKGGEP